MQQKLLQEYLRVEFMRRCKMNARYSLRSFARFLSLEPSSLSKIMRGVRSPSQKTAEIIASKLGMKLSEFKLSESSIEREMDFIQISIDAFQISADWFHYAILELATIPGFRCETAWIAKRLSISKEEANQALSRLKRLGYLAYVDGQWKDVSGNLSTTEYPFTTSAFQSLQKQLLSKAAEAMDEIPLEKRDQSSMTLSIDSRLIPEAKKKIKEFRRSLTSYLQSSSSPDEVYQISISLFPATKPV